MNLPILSPVKSSNIHQFIEYWSKLYFYPDIHFYKNIHKTILAPHDLQELFQWKNGMNLSFKKQTSLDRKVQPLLYQINKYKNEKDIDLQCFQNTFKEVSTVWKIFILHIIKPTQFPIYDQNVHRAYLYITNKEYRNFKYNSLSNKKKEQFYFEEYLPFIEGLKFEDVEKLDKAFFVFGQFINTKEYKSILSKN